MFSKLARLFCRPTSPIRRPARRPRLGLETLEERTVMSAWIPQAGPAAAPDGSVYSVDAQQRLHHQVGGSDITLDYNVSTFAIGTDSSVYERHADGFMVHWVGTTPASMWANIADYGVRNDGLLYQLHTNADLTLITPTNALVADFGYMKGFGMRSDGNAYLWNTGNNVLLNTPRATTTSDSRTGA